MAGKLYGIQHGRLLQAELDWAKCGSEANYRGHLRRGERPCASCREAMNRVRRERYNPQLEKSSRLQSRGV